MIQMLQAIRTMGAEVLLYALNGSTTSKYLKTGPILTDIENI